MASNSESLIQIVPSLWPAIDGIGDYALQLARQLRTHAGVETSFIVCDPAWRHDLWSGEFKAIGLKSRTEKLMLEAVLLLSGNHMKSTGEILVHFSPYGYQKRGCPIWLVASMEALRKRMAASINVAFHELDVDSSRMLSSAYWVPRLQRFLMRRLLRISTFIYTNTGVHRLKLEAWGKKDVLLIPNFSNIGELDHVPPTGIRERNVVIFGRADQRRWTYAKGADALATLCAGMNATRIIDIGAPLPEHTCSEIAGVPVIRRGVLPASEIGAIMRSSMASFMYYPVPLLTKSGVHALSCASGTVPFVCSGATAESTCPGLTEGLDYIVIGDAQRLPSLATVEGLAPAIYASYSRRASSVAALTIAAKLYGSDANAPNQLGAAGSFLVPPSSVNVVRSRNSLPPLKNHEVAL